MREALDQWDFVVAAYVVGMFATFAMIAWAWAAMRKAEKLREEAKSRAREKTGRK